MLIPGIALFAVRDKLEESYYETLKELCESGYKAVEITCIYTEVEYIRDYFREIDIIPYSSHFDFDRIVNEPEEVIFDSRTMGCKRVAVNHCETRNEKDINNIVKDLSSVVDIYEKNGIELYYHNHGGELDKKIDSEFPLIKIYDKLNGRVKLDLDIFWVWSAGIDPCDFIEKHHEKIGMVHLKDGTMDTVTPFGSGEINFKPILAKLNEHDINRVFIESIDITSDGMETAKKELAVFNGLVSSLK